jgi:predicted DNA-binding transcriptional regulator AlpA
MVSQNVPSDWTTPKKQTQPVAKRPKAKRFDINSSRRQTTPRQQFKSPTDNDGGDGDEDPAPKPPRLVSKKQVLERVPLSFVTIWKMMNAGTFPKSRSIGENRTVWLESEIDQWILETPTRRLKSASKREG